MGQKEQADTLETECPLGETGRPLIKARSRSHSFRLVKTLALEWNSRSEN